MDSKRILQAKKKKKKGQPRRNEQIFRNVQSPKTESRRNRKYEQTNHKY